FSAARADASLSVSSAMATNATGEFWRATIADAGRPFFGSRPFGFGLYGSGSAVRENGDGAEENRWSWEMANSEIVVSKGYDRNGAEPCTSSDPSCVAEAKRIWRPVAIDGDSILLIDQMLYLHERGKLHNGHFEDGIGWIDVTGSPIDLTTYELLIA